MNAIIGMTQIARRADGLDKIRECINKIEASSHHLLGLLNNILDMSKIEAGKLTLVPEPLKISEEILFVISMMRSRARESGIEITQEVKIKRDHVSADKLRLNQILINLLSNAVKFSPSGGHIRLTAEETEPGADASVYRFLVEDQGIGMTEEQTSRLFKSFEQADMSITKRFGGTGLGLSISKSIVEMMGGHIGVESKPGKGSTFFFTVRLSAALKIDGNGNGKKTVADSNEIPHKESVDFSKIRALVVDDIEINRVIVAEMLADTQIKIEEAATGREAVEIFDSSAPGHFDIIFMDMQMPEMDGCEASRAIRALLRKDAKKIPIVAMTANVMKSDVEQVLDAGMNGHIAKPIDFENVIDTIRRMCMELDH